MATWTMKEQVPPQIPSLDPKDLEKAVVKGGRS